MSYIDPPRKLLYHIDRIAAIQAGEHPAPVNVEIDLSNRCNLGCCDCHFAHTHSRGPLARTERPDYMTPVGDLMDADLAIRIINELIAAGVRSITWTGGGEPTLHPAFDRAIAHAADRWLDQGLYTNGTTIDEERAALLKRCCRWVYVSLDAHDASSYEAYKGADKFDQVLAGIRNLVQAEGNATIGIGFLLGPKNWWNGNEMIVLGQSLGVDYIQFRPVIHAGQDRTWLKPCIQWLQGEKDACGVEVDLTRFEMYRRWSGHAYEMCHWAQLQTVITPNGKVWTCVNRRGYDGDELGDLTQETFAEIWKRSAAKVVNDRCRVMCRGHIPNLTLNRILNVDDEHRRFI